MTRTTDSIPKNAARVSEHGARIAAGKIGCTVDEYRRREAVGEAWCCGCRDWHERGAFSKQASRPNGLQGYCRRAQSEAYADRRVYVLASDHRRHVAGISYAGPAFSKGRRRPPTPESAAAARPVPPTTAAAASSGHIYRTVTLMTPVQAAEIMETTWRLGVKGSVVTRDGLGRAERKDTHGSENLQDARNGRAGSAAERHGVGAAEGAALLELSVRPRRGAGAGSRDGVLREGARDAGDHAVPSDPHEESPRFQGRCRVPGLRVDGRLDRAEEGRP